MSNMVVKHKAINTANDWVKESEDYTKTLGTDLEKEKSNKSFLNTSLEKINDLIKFGEQHNNTLNGISKAIQMAQAVPLTGGQTSDINKQMTEVTAIIQKVQATLKTLKDFKEKITGFLAIKSDGNDQDPPKNTE